MGPAVYLRRRDIPRSVMADRTDTFIREVEEELRREHLQRLWERFGVYLVGAAVLLVLAVAGYKYVQHDRITTAQASGARYEAAVRLAASGKAEDAHKAFEELTKGSSAGYATLARLRLAAAAAKAGNTSEAIKTYDAIAGGSSAAPDALLRDFAALQAAMLSLDTADWTQMQNRLNDLANDRNPWRASARELLGLAAYKAGKLDEARKEFERLLGDKATPPSMVERTQLMLSVLTETETGKATAPQRPEQATDKAPGKAGTEPAKKE